MVGTLLVKTIYSRQLKEFARIVAVIHSLDGGGAERVMAGLVSRWATIGHQTHLITVDPHADDRYDVHDRVIRHTIDAVETAMLGRWGGWRRLQRIRRLRRLIRRLHPDCVLAFCDATNRLTLMATRNRPPTYVHERSDPASQTPGRIDRIVRRIYYRRAEGVFTQTPAAAQFLSAEIGKPVSVIASPIEAVSVPKPDHRQAIVLGVGRLEREKRFDRLIDAFATIADRRPEWKLRIVGDGSLRGDLERQIQRLNIQDRVELIGWVRDVDPHYADASIFALSSDYEGYPRAMLEAMIREVPIVSVDCPVGPTDILQGGEFGRLTDRDADALAVGIDQTIAHMDSARRTAASARVHILETNHWNVILGRYALAMGLPQTTASATGSTTVPDRSISI